MNESTNISGRTLPDRPSSSTFPLPRHTEAVSKYLDKANTERAAAEYRAQVMQEVFPALPGSVPTPVVSNASEAGDYGPVVWLSFGRHYPDRTSPLGATAILAALESAGFCPMECSRVQWGAYARVIEPEAYDRVPAMRRHRRLTSSTPSAPVWGEWQIGYGSIPDCWEVSAWYRAPSGRLVRVSVDAALPVFATAEYVANSRAFGRPAKYQNPRLEGAGKWAYVGIPGFAPLTLSAGSRAWLSPHAEGRRAISARVHFEPADSGEMAAPSVILAALAAAS